MGLPADRLPMVLGCDGAGVDEAGNEVIVHAVVPSDGWRGDETLDPRRTLLSELHDGTLAEQVVVPSTNVVPKPESMSWQTAACLSTAWLTAYRMLFTNSGVQPGGTVLVQGAGGGVATALIQLGSAAGYRMWATSRDEARGERALEIGADRVFASGERLPDRVDAVMETVGAATWSHSVNSLRPGGTIVISGATSGDAPAKAELTKIFFKQLRVVGSTMGTQQELGQLARLVVQAGHRARHRLGATARRRPRRLRPDGRRRRLRQGRLHRRLKAPDSLIRTATRAAVGRRRPASPSSRSHQRAACSRATSCPSA